MAWTRTGRRLPTNWPTIRTATKNRDGWQCTATLTDGTRCTQTTRLEVDHIADPNNHHPDNLRTLCHTHHAAHTATQAATARWGKHTRPAEQHPGLTTTHQQGNKGGGGTPGGTPPPALRQG